MYSNVGDPFEAWVHEQVEIHNAKLVTNNVIEMDAEVAEAFRASTAVSCK